MLRGMENKKVEKITFERTNELEVFKLNIIFIDNYLTKDGYGRFELTALVKVKDIDYEEERRERTSLDVDCLGKLIKSELNLNIELLAQEDNDLYKIKPLEPVIMWKELWERLI